MAGDLDFRGRERLVLYSGVAAVAFVALVLVAAIAGSSLGDLGSRLAMSLVLLYLCARLWSHAKTLEEREVDELLSAVSRYAAPCIFVVLFAQIWVTSSLDMHIDIGVGLPHPHVSLWPRIEWTADVLVIGLFLVTAIAVWIEESDGVSKLVSWAAYSVIGFLTVFLLGGVWGVVSPAPHWRLVLALIVLSFSSTIVVATLRRVERLDEGSDEEIDDDGIDEAPAA